MFRVNNIIYDITNIEYTTDKDDTIHLSVIAKNEQVEPDIQEISFNCDYKNPHKSNIMMPIVGQIFFAEFEVVEGFIVFKKDTVTIKGVTDLHWEAPLDYNVPIEITFNQKGVI